MSGSKSIVHAPDAPDNTGINSGHFSQATRVGTVYIGGTLAIDQHAQRVDVDDDPRTAIRRACANLQLICRAAGAELAYQGRVSRTRTGWARPRRRSGVRRPATG